MLESAPVRRNESFRTNVMNAFEKVISDLSGEDPAFLVSDDVRDVVMRSIVDLANAGQFDAKQLRQFGFSQGAHYQRKHGNE